MLKAKGMHIIHIILFAVLLTISISLTNINTVKASESDPVQVGHLVDEDFSVIHSAVEKSITYKKISGWDIDASGGSYETSELNWFKLIDKSSNAAVTMQRKFISQDAGAITLEYRFKLAATDQMNGVTWQLRSGEVPGVVISISNGMISYEDSNGSMVDIDVCNTYQEYGIKVIADISSKTANIYIDGVLKAAATDFRNTVGQLDTIFIRTGDTSTGDLYIAPVKIYKGYNVMERLLTTAEGTVPEDWASGAQGGTVGVQRFDSSFKPDSYSFRMNDTSSTQNVSLSKSFSALTGKTVFDYRFLLPVKVDGMSAELMDDAVTGMKIVTSGGNLCYVAPGGVVTAIQPYIANLWYHIKIVADSSTDKADIYINEKLKSTNVDFANPSSKINKIMYSTPASGKGVLWLDDIKVFPYQAEPSDYVPEPVPAADSSYYVGMQSCSLWREGHYAGWDWIREFPERQSYLGWYDEGSTETADWEIKWMTEHGVDFQLYCWFSPLNSDRKGSPIKVPEFGEALNDGFLNAKYSNSMKFAIMWENAAVKVGGSNDFRKNFVPYWIEYYFKDPRYLVIDNKPVMSIYSFYRLLNDFSDVKAEMDYLRQACIDAGFSGITLITANPGTSANELNYLKTWGFEYSYAYGWGTGDINVQKNNILSAQGKGIMDMIPTISMGYANGAWRLGYKSDWTPVSDFQSMGEWVRDVYLPSLPVGSLAKSMVLLDNWNEYGEGHFIMPTALAGFGYLDGVKNVFTSGNQLHEDIIPTTGQRARINTLYPRSYIPGDLDELKAWKFDVVGDTEEWTAEQQVSNINTSSGFLNGNSTGSSPSINSSDNLNMDITSSKLIKVKYKNSTGSSTASLSFITDSDTVWDEVKKIDFTVKANDTVYTEYLIDMSTIPGWAGTLKQIKLNPCSAAGEFSIDYIKIINSEYIENWDFDSGASDEGWKADEQIASGIRIADGYYTATSIGTAPQLYSRDLLDIDITNNKKIKIRLKNSTSGTTASLYFITDSNLSWDESKKMSFQVIANDSNYREYILDMTNVSSWTGRLKRLKFKPANATGEISIDYIRITNEVVTRFWEFNSNNNLEGWTQSYQVANKIVADGKYTADSTGLDPQIFSSDFLDINTAVNKIIRIKMKNSTSGPGARLYFITDSDTVWNEAKSKYSALIVNDPGYTEYVFDMSNVPGWNGTLRRLRFDPTNAAGQFSIDYIRIYKI